MNHENVVPEVLKDLAEMAKLDMCDGERCKAYVAANEGEIQMYYAQGMSIEEISNFVVILAH